MKIFKWIFVTSERVRDEFIFRLINNIIFDSVNMKVLRVDDKVSSVGSENEPTVVVDTQKKTKEELNRYPACQTLYSVYSYCSF